MATQVPLARFAQVRAEMEAGTSRDTALARAGLSHDEWTGAQRAWLESMGAELTLGRFELTNRYAQAFLERQRALTTAFTPLRATPGETATAGRVAANAAMPGLDAAPRVAEAKPTFLAAEATSGVAAPSAPPVQRPNPLLSGTMAVDVSAFMPSLPFDAKASAASVPVPQSLRRSRELTRGLLTRSGPPLGKLPLGASGCSRGPRRRRVCSPEVVHPGDVVAVGEARHADVAIMSARSVAPADAARVSEDAAEAPVPGLSSLVQA